MMLVAWGWVRVSLWTTFTLSALELDSRSRLLFVSATHDQAGARSAVGNEVNRLSRGGEGRERVQSTLSLGGGHIRNGGVAHATPMDGSTTARATLETEPRPHPVPAPRAPETASIPRTALAHPMFPGFAAYLSTPSMLRGPTSRTTDDVDSPPAESPARLPHRFLQQPRRTGTSTLLSLSSFPPPPQNLVWSPPPPGPGPSAQEQQVMAARLTRINMSMTTGGGITPPTAWAGRTVEVPRDSLVEGRAANPHLGDGPAPAAAEAERITSRLLDRAGITPAFLNRFRNLAIGGDGDAEREDGPQTPVQQHGHGDQERGSAATEVANAMDLDFGGQAGDQEAQVAEAGVPAEDDHDDLMQPGRRRSTMRFLEAAGDGIGRSALSTATRSRASTRTPSPQQVLDIPPENHLLPSMSGVGAASDGSEVGHESSPHHRAPGDLRPVERVEDRLAEAVVAEQIINALHRRTIANATDAELRSLALLRLHHAAWEEDERSAEAWLLRNFAQPQEPQERPPPAPAATNPSTSSAINAAPSPVLGLPSSVLPVLRHLGGEAPAPPPHQSQPLPRRAAAFEDGAGPLPKPKPPPTRGVARTQTRRDMFLYRVCPEVLDALIEDLDCLYLGNVFKAGLQQPEENANREDEERTSVPEDDQEQCSDPLAGDCAWCCYPLRGLGKQEGAAADEEEPCSVLHPCGHALHTKCLDAYIESQQKEHARKQRVDREELGRFQNGARQRILDPRNTIPQGSRADPEPVLPSAEMDTLKCPMCRSQFFPIRAAVAEVPIRAAGAAGSSNSASKEPVFLSTSWSKNVPAPFEKDGEICDYPVPAAVMADLCASFLGCGLQTEAQKCDEQYYLAVLGYKWTEDGCFGKPRRNRTVERRRRYRRLLLRRLAQLGRWLKKIEANYADLGEGGETSAGVGPAGASAEPGAQLREAGADPVRKEAERPFRSRVILFLVLNAIRFQQSCVEDLHEKVEAGKYKQDIAAERQKVVAAAARQANNGSGQAPRPRKMLSLRNKLRKKFDGVTQTIATKAAGAAYWLLSTFSVQHWISALLKEDLIDFLLEQHMEVLVQDRAELDENSPAWAFEYWEQADKNETDTSQGLGTTSRSTFCSVLNLLEESLHAHSVRQPPSLPASSIEEEDSDLQAVLRRRSEIEKDHPTCSWPSSTRSLAALEYCLLDPPLPVTSILLEGTNMVVGDDDDKPMHALDTAKIGANMVQSTLGEFFGAFGDHEVDRRVRVEFGIPRTAVTALDGDEPQWSLLGALGGPGSSESAPPPKSVCKRVGVSSSLDESFCEAVDVVSRILVVRTLEKWIRRIRHDLKREAEEELLLARASCKNDGEQQLSSGAGRRQSARDEQTAGSGRTRSNGTTDDHQHQGEGSSPRTPGETMAVAVGGTSRAEVDSDSDRERAVDPVLARTGLFRRPRRPHSSDGHYNSRPAARGRDDWARASSSARSPGELSPEASPWVSGSTSDGLEAVDDSDEDYVIQRPPRSRAAAGAESRSAVASMIASAFGEPEHLPSIVAAAEDLLRHDHSSALGRGASAGAGGNTGPHHAAPRPPTFNDLLYRWPRSDFEGPNPAYPNPDLDEAVRNFLGDVDAVRAKMDAHERISDSLAGFEWDSWCAHLRHLSGKDLLGGVGKLKEFVDTVRRKTMMKDKESLPRAQPGRRGDFQLEPQLFDLGLEDQEQDEVREEDFDGPSSLPWFSRSLD